MRHKGDRVSIKALLMASSTLSPSFTTSRMLTSREKANVAALSDTERSPLVESLS